MHNQEMTMTAAERIRLTAQIAVLRDIAIDYQGKTIDNIIRQMEARLSEVIKQENNIDMTTFYKLDMPPKYEVIQKENIMVQTPFYRRFENNKRKHK